MILAIALAAGVVFATPLPPPASEVDLARAYADATRAADLHSDGFSVDATPEAHDALERRWTLAAQWASAILNAHPDATPEEIATVVLNSDKNMGIMPLDGDSWLVTTGKTEGDFSSFAILKTFDGRYRPVWYAWRDAAASTQYPLLRAWSADAARKDCRDNRGEGHWLECGPLYSSAKLLPRDAKGRARFYVDAGYVEDVGNTAAAQLSIWTWDGKTAAPLTVSGYSFAIDQDVGVRVEGNILKVRERQDFKTFFACYSCLGRQVDHAFLIRPDAVRDLGRTSVTPELDTVDAAFDRLHRGLPVEGLASAQAAGVMETILRNTSEPGENPKNFTLGMLLNSVLRPVKAGTELCFSADSTGTFVFTLTRRTGRFFIAHARPDSGGEACKAFPK